jgi:hypothetical protein
MLLLPLLLRLRLLLLCCATLLALFAAADPECVQTHDVAAHVEIESKTRKRHSN